MNPGLTTKNKMNIDPSYQYNYLTNENYNYFGKGGNIDVDSDFTRNVYEIKSNKGRIFKKPNYKNTHMEQQHMPTFHSKLVTPNIRGLHNTYDNMDLIKTQYLEQMIPVNTNDLIRNQIKKNNKY